MITGLIKAGSDLAGGTTGADWEVHANVVPADGALTQLGMYSAWSIAAPSKAPVK